MMRFFHHLHWWHFMDTFESMAGNHFMVSGLGRLSKGHVMADRWRRVGVRWHHGGGAHELVVALHHLGYIALVPVHHREGGRHGAWETSCDKELGISFCIRCRGSSSYRKQEDGTKDLQLHGEYFPRDDCSS